MARPLALTFWRVDIACRQSYKARQQLGSCESCGRILPFDSGANMNGLASGTSAADTSLVRRAMVDCQVRTFGVTDLDVLSSMEDVARELFVPAGKRALAYSDSSVVLEADGEKRYLLPPMFEARMMQLADISASARVLVVGAGSGYAAAVLARIAGAVTVLETPAFAALAKQALAAAGAGSVQVVAGDLSAGHAAGAPYDVILICGACSAQPAAVLAQLVDGGRLLMIRRLQSDPTGRAGKAVKIERSGASFSESELFEAAAPVLPGFAGQTAFAF